MQRRIESRVSQARRRAARRWRRRNASSRRFVPAPTRRLPRRRQTAAARRFVPRRSTKTAPAVVAADGRARARIGLRPPTTICRRSPSRRRSRAWPAATPAANRQAGSGYRIDRHAATGATGRCRRPRRGPARAPGQAAALVRPYGAEGALAGAGFRHARRPFAEVAACLLLADRNGAASRPQLETFVRVMGELAPLLPAAMSAPDVEAEAERAETLDRLCADVDVQIGLTVLESRRRGHSRHQAARRGRSRRLPARVRRSLRVGAGRDRRRALHAAEHAQRAVHGRHARGCRPPTASCSYSTCRA